LCVMWTTLPVELVVLVASFTDSNVTLRDMMLVGGRSGTGQVWVGAGRGLILCVRRSDAGATPLTAVRRCGVRARASRYARPPVCARYLGRPQKAHALTRPFFVP
jgi:hypothetical protein